MPTSEQLQIIGMAFSPFMVQALYVAARLRIADRLGAGPRSVEDLAVETGVHAPSLRRLLRAIAGAGIFADAGLKLERVIPTPSALCIIEGARV